MTTGLANSLWTMPQASKWPGFELMDLICLRFASSPKAKNFLSGIQ